MTAPGPGARERSGSCCAQQDVLLLPSHEYILQYVPGLLVIACAFPQRAAGLPGRIAGYVARSTSDILKGKVSWLLPPRPWWRLPMIWTASESEACGEMLKLRRTSVTLFSTLPYAP